MRTPLIALVAALGLAGSAAAPAASVAMAAASAPAPAASSAPPAAVIPSSGTVSAGTGSGGGAGRGGGSVARGVVVGSGGRGGYGVVARGFARSGGSGVVSQDEQNTWVLGPRMGSAAAATRVTDRFRPGPPTSPGHRPRPRQAAEYPLNRPEAVATYCTAVVTPYCPPVEMPSPLCVEPYYLNGQSPVYRLFNCARPIKAPLSPADQDEELGPAVLPDR